MTFTLAPCGCSGGPTRGRQGGAPSSRRARGFVPSPWDLTLDRLLHVLGSAWDCPPSLEEVIESLPLLIPQLHGARVAFEDHSRSNPSTAADGRLCTLMAFCCLMTNKEVRAHLVLEEPGAAIGRLQSLGLSSHHSLALWERSLRNAILSLAGTPTEVSIGPGTGSTAQCGDHRPESTDVWRVAVVLAGSHESLPAIEVPDETPATTSELERLRSYWAIGRRGGLPADAG